MGVIFSSGVTSSNLREECVHNLAYNRSNIRACQFRHDSLKQAHPFSHSNIRINDDYQYKNNGAKERDL